MRNKSNHKVSCAVCGRKGAVKVDKKRKIAGKRWNFFGIFSVKSDPMTLASQKFEAEAINPNANPVPIEYWECEDCFKDVQAILKRFR